MSNFAEVARDLETIPAALLTRPDVERIVRVAETMGVRFRISDLFQLECLADRWSSDSILCAVSLAADEYAEYAVERFRGQARRALEFLASTPLKWNDERLLYAWQEFRAGRSHYRTLHDLDAWAAFGQLMPENCEQIQ